MGPHTHDHQLSGSINYELSQRSMGPDTHDHQISGQMLYELSYTHQSSTAGLAQIKILKFDNKGEQLRQG